MAKNIYQRINEVRKKVPYVQKDATVQGYRAVTHDMVTAVLRDALVDAGIVIVTTFLDGESVPAGETKQGTVIIRFEAVYRIEFVNADDPADRFGINMPAHANDMSDKAPGKATSYAVKYALLKIFSLETGENEESRVESDRKADQLIAHLKTEVQEYIEHGDALAIFLLSQSVGQDAWIEIYNSAPDGKKSAFKKQLSQLETQGGEILTAINQAILTDDASAAIENIEDVTEGGKRLLAQKLGPDKAAKLGEFKKRLAA